MGMKPKHVTVDELCELMEISWKELKTLLKRNSFSVPSPKKPIKRSEAEKIFEYFRRERINWIEFEQRNKVGSLGPVLEQKFTHGDGRLIDECWRDVKKEFPHLDRIERGVLGYAVQGGYLKGKGEKPFLFTVSKSINMVIGDRGAGKSTLLKWAAPFQLAQGDVKRQSDLITSILSSSNIKTDELYSKIQSIHNELLSHGLNSLFWFYRHQFSTYVFGVKEENRYFCARFDGVEWSEVEGDFHSSLPKVQLLRQGDVFRISDVEDELVFNKMFDELYPDLKQLRAKLSQRVKKLATQFENVDETSIRNEWLSYEEMEGYLVRQSIDFRPIRRFVRHHRDSIMAQKKQFAATGDHQEFFSFYEKLYAEAKLGELSSEYDLFLVSEDERTLEAIWLLPIRRRFRRWLEVQEKPVMQDHAKSIDPEEFLIIHELLWAALDKMRDLFEALNGSLIPNRTLKGLLRSGADVASIRTEIRTLQNEVCRAANKKLSASLPTAELSSSIDLLAIDSSVFETKVGSLDDLIYTLQALDLSGAFSTSIELVNSYKRSTQKLVVRCRNLDSSNVEPSYGQLCDPIQSELSRGGVAVPFEKLSFGQKSAFVLGILLTHVNSEFVVLDQPEDNLDTDGVVSILVPLLERLQRVTPILVATHNAHLTLGVQRVGVCTLQSRGDHSIISAKGALSDKKVMHQILHVLEGGVEAFQSKLEKYEGLLENLGDEFSKVEMSDLEVHFRRKTIDDLRGHLQPLMMGQSTLERDFMAVASHEVRQKSPNTILESLGSLDEVISEVIKSNPGLGSLLESVRSTSNRIEGYARNVKAAVDNLRMFNTHPEKEAVRPYELLEAARLRRLEAFQYEGRDAILTIDQKLQGSRVYIDPGHFTLIFENLIQNSFRATESQATSHIEVGNYDFIERVNINQVGDADDESFIYIEISDNGSGIAEDILPHLYERRISSGRGRDRGMGGMIISKLLEANDAAIKVTETCTEVVGHGSKQVITIPIWRGGEGE